jgi:LacI family transcriptional regulator
MGDGEMYGPKNAGNIRDVARKTGLSTATISRVMNGATNVSTATRERVLAACKELAYVPNPAARTLTTKKSKTIAAIIPTIENTVFAKFISTIEQALSERGYSLVIAISNASVEQELAAVDKLLGMGAEAFILTGATHSEELYDRFERRNVPFILMSIWYKDFIKPLVGYDNFALAKRGVEYLVAHGHRNIAALHSSVDINDRMHERKNGAQAAGANLIFFETELSVAGGKQATRSILKAINGSIKSTRPTAIFCFSDVIALGVYFGLMEAKINIPSDISVVGFDNLELSEYMTPALTTINLPARKMGRNVATQLMDMLDHKTPIQPKLLEGYVVERQSVQKL